MEKNNEEQKPDQTERRSTEEKKAVSLEGLPVKSSPYVQYEDLEDYKRQAYGTEGHIQPKPGRDATASTDAPTGSNGAVSTEEPKLSATDVINSQGVP